MKHRILVVMLSALLATLLLPAACGGGDGPRRVLPRLDPLATPVMAAAPDVPRPAWASPTPTPDGLPEHVPMPYATFCPPPTADGFERLCFGVALTPVTP